MKYISQLRTTHSSCLQETEVACYGSSSKERHAAVDTVNRESSSGCKNIEGNKRQQERIWWKQPRSWSRRQKEAEDGKFLAATARDELRMAKDLAEQAKTGMSIIEMEADRASEKLTLAAIKLCKGLNVLRDFDEINNSPRSIIISVEDYYELSKHAQESEEANTKLSQIVSQIQVARGSE